MAKLAIDGGKPVRKKFLVFGKPCMNSAEERAAVRVLRSGWISTGRESHAFEKEFAAYVGAREGVAVSSCTAALHLALVLAGAQRGREVITTPLTFVATAEAILYTGARVVFADVDLRTGQIDPEDVARRVNRKTCAIVPVHYAGYPAPMDALMRIARRRRLTVIEDAAHAVETWSGRRKVGRIGDYTCFSFYATKNLTCAEGGMITLQDSKLAGKLRMMRLHGMSKDAWKRYGSKVSGGYDVPEMGFKYNLTDLQAAIAREQLKKVRVFWKRRQAVVRRYEKYFAGHPLVRTLSYGPGTNAYHFFPIFLNLARLNKTRDEFLAALSAENIGCGVHFTPVHLFSHYRKILRLRKGDYPNAETLGLSEISLPVYPSMTPRDVSDTISGVEKVLEMAARR
ncbi:DegT/DnrJ/EryC1/StrS family aminotransferase [bacterium]|nr:DegT/DnrJ/EryC1/StrS family aminotransferase [bacterium]